MYGDGERKKLTRENLAEAKKDFQLLTNPGYGGYNLCYNDNYFGAAMQRKWVDWQTMKEQIEAMEVQVASTAGAGI